MAKRVDPLKAKAAKQRKIAIGLSLLLLGVVALQGPKTLKMLKGPAAPVAAADPATVAAGSTLPAGVPAPTTGAPVAPTTPVAAGAPTAGAPTTAAPAADTTSEPAVLANTDIPVTAGAGQLLSFEQFVSKDPFQQQVAAGGPVGVDEPEAAADPTAGATDTPPTGLSAAESGTDPPSTDGIGTSGSSGGSTPDPGPSPATSTTISVNGVVETVILDTPFPAEQPTFELVSLAKDYKSVQIGVAGGTLMGGGATVKLTLGKPLTLQNTADGSRYKLVLVTVAGGTSPASKG